jgi:D-arginine dehydrogenase
MNDFDIIIVGGGIAGASLGAEVAAKRRTLIIEAEDQCGFHSTGRSAAFYLESYGGRAVAELTLASGAFLERPPSVFSERGFLFRRGGLSVSDGPWPEVPDGVVARRIEREALELMVPGLRPRWTRALFEPGCADIDVGALHAAFLGQFRRAGGTVSTDSRLEWATWSDGAWSVSLTSGSNLRAALLVDGAGAWGDEVAVRCGVAPLGLEPKRRTMVQLRVGRSGLKDLPLVNDAGGTFYFKGEGDRTLWLSPHDEIPSAPGDVAPEEIDIATAIARFEAVVDWPVEHVERSWAGLRTFAPDRFPVYGFDPSMPQFFWCVGQGGFGIQTSPAAARLAASLLLAQAPDPMVAHIDPGAFSPARFIR